MSLAQMDCAADGGRCVVRLPIDTSRLKFLVVAAAEPLRQYEEGKPRESWAPRTDVNGEVLWVSCLLEAKGFCPLQ